MSNKFLKNIFFLASCFLFLASSIKPVSANTWYFTNNNHPSFTGKRLEPSFSGGGNTRSKNKPPIGETSFNNGTSTKSYGTDTLPTNTIPAGTWSFSISAITTSNSGWYPRMKIFDSDGNLIHTTTSPNIVTSSSWSSYSWTDSLPAFNLGSNNYYRVQIFTYRPTKKGNKADKIRINSTWSVGNYIVDPYIPPTYIPKSRAWRFYDDHTSLTPSVPYAGEEVTPSGMYNHNQIRLRETIAELGGASQTGRKKLRFSSDAVNFTDVGEIGSGAVWSYCDGGGTDDSLVPSLLLSTSSTFGPFVESGTAASSYTHNGYDSAEYDFCLQENMALTNTTYFFQLIDVTSGAIIYPDATYNWPNITISTHGMILEVDPNFNLLAINLNDAPGPTTGTFSNMYIRDHTGALGGWSVTATATDFISGSNIITIDNLTMTSNSISPLLAESTSGINLGSGQLSNTVPLNVATATSGNGAGNFVVGGEFSLYIPVASTPGAYSSTMTITIS